MTTISEMGFAVLQGPWPTTKRVAWFPSLDAMDAAERVAPIKGDDLWLRMEPEVMPEDNPA